MSKETNETNELQSKTIAMDSAEFEAKLTDFFSRHKESKLKLVPRIVEEFKGHETAVLEHLHNKYVLEIVPEKHKKKSKHKAEGEHPETASGEVAAEEKPKKSKKKLIIIAIAVIVLGALGAVGFIMKDKFMGKHEEPKTETPPAEIQPAAEQPKVETTPAEEVKQESAEPAENEEAPAVEEAKTE